ncbi:MAG TPA: Na+/H+ antiporter subunit E [Euzebyales bacterium]|nr:Na+/H+ antiporter subunit E [Euzebyales bacterium]
MTHVLSVALPVAVLWVLVTGRISPGSALVGLLIGTGTALELRRMGVRAPARVTLDRVGALLHYVGHLTWSGVRSSIQVARLILRPRLDLRTGIVALHAGETTAPARLAALSAHGINMSPGQLVVDFSDDGPLFVHLIDLRASRPTLEAEQRERVLLLRRILGDAGERSGE